MDVAYQQAQCAFLRGEVPVGAAIIHYPTKRVLAYAHNMVESLHDPTAHAEMLVIKEAGSILGATHLTECDLYVTLEPCPMCAQAIAHAMVRRLYFGAYDIKGGGVDHGAKIFNASSCHHKPEVIGGIEEAKYQNLLQSFFRQIRHGSA